jgi:hypothetical protein
MEDIQSTIHAIQANITMLTGLLKDVNHVSLAFADSASDKLFLSAQDLIAAARSLLATALHNQHAPMPRDSFMHCAASSPDMQPVHLVDRVYSHAPFINAIVRIKAHFFLLIVTNSIAASECST